MDGEPIGEVAQPVYTGVEVGKRHVARGKRSIEYEWREGCKNDPDIPSDEREIDIDRQVTAIVEKAYSSGERSINILDIGSGEGVFVSSFANPQEYPHLHDFLTDHEGLQVNVIGITSANAGSEQGTEIDSHQQNFDNGSKINTSNNRYTVTRAQTIGQFIDRKLRTDNTDETTQSFAKLDMVFSTKAIGYFTPANFRQALIDATDRLSANGVIFIADYDMVPAGYKRSQSFGSNSLRTSSAENNPNHPLSMYWQQTYDEKSPAERKAMLMKLVKFAGDKGFLSPTELASLSSQEIYSRSEDENTDTEDIEQIKSNLCAINTLDGLVETIDKIDQNDFERFNWTWSFHKIIDKIKDEDNPVAIKQEEKTRVAKRQAFKEAAEKEGISVSIGTHNARIKKRES